MSSTTQAPPPDDATAAWHALVDDLRGALDQLAGPLRDSAASAARLVQHLGVRLDALSLDLARDLGAVTRDAQSLAGAARDRAQTLAHATPRAARLAQAGAALLARHRWLRLAAAARGHAALRPEDHRDLARRTARAAAELRGGIAKLGQLASCRPDLVGPIWAAELAALQADVPRIDSAAIRARIEAELGKPIAECFAELDDAPLAAASLAQVHGGRLHDGTRVAVKVQVPGIEDVIDADIAALRTFAGALRDFPGHGLDLPTIVDELARALVAELDYVAEAAALRSFTTAAAIPRPIAEASSPRVLTMTRLDGERLSTALDAMPAGERDRVLGELVDEIAAQVLVRGHVHADPHPGNFLITPDGKLGLLDFGCTLVLDARERAAYARLVLAIAGGDRVAASRELVALGFAADDPEQLVALTASLIGAMRPGASVSELDWEAGFADQLARARRLGGLVIPRSFVLLGRVLAMIAGLLARYRPRIQLHALIAPHLAAAIG
jgi:ubiquinone biosynthesis protein